MTRSHSLALAMPMAVPNTRAWLFRRLTLALAALALLGGGIAAPTARAQTGNTTIRQFSGVPSGACANIQIAVNLLNGDLYDCLAGGWHLVSSAGGAGTFDLIGSGVNTSATMTLGTGGTLTFSGSGINNASAIRGVSITGTPGAGQIPISSSSTAAAWGDPIIQGTQAAGSTTIPNPLVSGGSDYGGTPAIRTWKVDSAGSGHLTIDNASAIMGNCGATTVNAHQYCGNNTAANGVAPGFVVPVLSDIASSSSANNYTFTGNDTEGLWNSVRIVDGTKFTTCNAAVADLGANPGIVIIPSIYAGAECSVTPDNITLWDFRAGSSRMEQGVHYRVNDGSTHIRMLIADLLNASNLTSNQNHAELYGKVNYNGNPTGGNQVVEAVTGLAGTDSTISGNFPGQIIGVEGTGDVAATGGFTVGTVKGGTFNTTLSAGNTNVSQMFSLYAQAPTKIGTGIITQAASFVAEDPCVGACPASTVNLSGWFLGDTRFDKHISQSVAPSASIGHFSRVSNFTGVGQQGMFIAPTFSSAATTEGEAIMARADLVAAAFVQSLNANFYSANPVFGSGSSATNHYGYYAEAQTSGATNYAYYAAGTEASFFGGPIQHGEIAAPSAVAGKDICYGDSTSHTLKCSYNNSAYSNVTLNPPLVAGTTDLGTAALPFGNIFFGTAATNNFKFQPAATAAARVISMPDPLGAVNMPYVIASGTSAMTTAAVAGGACGTTVTTAATGALTTDSIEVARNAAATAANGGLLALNWWVTAGNVNFNYCNGGTVSNTPTAMTINWRVIR